MKISLGSFPSMQLRALFCALFLTMCTGAPQQQGSVAPVAEAQAPSQVPQTPAVPERRFHPREAQPSEAIRSVLSVEAPRARFAAAEEALRRLEQIGTTSGSEDGASEVANAEEIGALHWIAARAAEAEEAFRHAETHYAALASSDHRLAPFAALEQAELAFEELRQEIEAAAPAVEQPDAESEASQEDADASPAEENTPAPRVLTLVEPLTRHAFSGQTWARSIYARALLLTGDSERAIPLLRTIVAETPDNIGAATAGMPLAAHLAQSEDVAEREEALALYRRVYTRAPKARVASRAESAAEGVLESLPEERQRILRVLPLADQLARAHALYGAMDHNGAERAFASAARRARRDDPRRCEARLMQGKAIVRVRSERARGAEVLQEVVRECSDPDVRAWARYKAARALTQVGENATAIRLYDAILDETPAHRVADDALYRSALLHGGAGRDARMIERLRALPERFPEGDMVGEGLFRLALHHREAGNLQASLEVLEAMIREDSRTDWGETHEDVRGRARYWRARTLEGLGDASASKTGYLDVLQRWPLSYYAQQAFARLRALSPDEANAYLRTIREPDPALVETSLPWRDEIDEPWFQTGLAFLRVGENERAMKEFREAGAIGEGADDDTVWLIAASLTEAGALPEVTHLVRRRLDGFRGTAPRGNARNLWRIAYPRAYSPLIEEQAQAAEVPSALIRGIAREESSFQTRAVSWAHAYGLTQLIVPTARRFGRDLGLRVTPATLKRPEVNVAIGARYMRYLQDHFADRPALVPSAYNAGEARVDQWVRQRRELPLDEFVERIPYDETRRYTRRVLQSWSIYAWLDQQRLPDWMPTYESPPSADPE